MCIPTYAHTSVHTSTTPPVHTPHLQELHSAYIVTGARCDIHCSPAVRKEIMKNIWPTFEELFDSAEEHVLQVLMEPWRELAEMDGYEVRAMVLTGPGLQAFLHSAHVLKSLRTYVLYMTIVNFSNSSTQRLFPFSG